MNISEARDGLSNALRDIAEIYDNTGITVTTKCALSNSDGDDGSDIDGAECIFADMILTVAGADKSVVLNSAICIFDAEGSEKYVSPDELAASVSQLRQDAKELLSQLSSVAREKNISLAEAMAAYLKNEEEAPPTEALLTEYDSPKYKKSEGSNTKFYVIASCVALLIVVIMLLMRSL